MYNSPQPLVATTTAITCGLVLAVYWGAVLVKGIKLSRKIGKDPNFVPRERTGQWMRLVWAPTVLAWCVQPWIAGLIPATSHHWLLARLLNIRSLPVQILAVVGTLAAIAALWATFICWHRMGRSWRIGIDPGETLELIVRGPYQYVRHPIYALSIALMLAVLAVVPTPLMLITAAVHITMLQVEARREEQYLISTHGQKYQDYRHAVGRFFPKFRAS